MLRLKGKANYKVDVLILVVEEKLPNGAHAWQEVAAIYQARSRESLLRDQDDVKRLWTDKCCNKFKKLTSSPGDPKRDMILRCQQIHKRILKKSASCIMGADSEGDVGLELSEDLEDSEEGSRTQSRGPTPTYAGNDDDDGGIGIIAPAELPIAPVPSLQSMTQQSAEGAAYNAPLYITRKLAEGATNAPLYQPRYGQVFLTPDMSTCPYQQLYLHRDFPSSGHGAFASLQQRAAVPLGMVPAQQQPAVMQTSVVATQQQPAGQQPGVNPPQPSTQQSAKKKVKKGSESLSNEKTKNSLSERRGSIVKSIDKLASSIVTTDEANSAAAASSSSMMPMFLVM